MTAPPVTEELRRQFWDDGVVVLGSARTDLDRPRRARHQAQPRNPGPYFQHHYEGTPRAFIDDYCNYSAIPEYQMLVECSPIVDIVASMLGTENLWLFYDQIFVKDAPDGQARRTPWHQDTTYWITGGTQLAGFWITLDDTPARESAGVRARFAPRPDLRRHRVRLHRRDHPLHARRHLPRIPDIEADRAASTSSRSRTHGDVIISILALLHGGGATGGQRRRTLSLRFFGDDVVYKEQPRPAPTYPGTSALIAPASRSAGRGSPRCTRGADQRVRILTTHAGSLPRPPALAELHGRRSQRRSRSTPASCTRPSRRRPRRCIAAQVDAGIDIGNDGEQARESFFTYVQHRMTGFGDTSQRALMRDLARPPRLPRAGARPASSG